MYLLVGIGIGVFLTEWLRPLASSDGLVLGRKRSPDFHASSGLHNQHSEWRFAEYVPSEWENEWAAWTADTKNSSELLHPCTRFRAEAGELAKAEQMLRLISEFMPTESAWNLTEWKSGTPGSQGGQPKRRSIWTEDTSTHPVLSKFIYSVGIGGKRSMRIAAFIEPLVAHLRHPYHCLDKKALLDTSYLLFDRRLPESDQTFPEKGARGMIPPKPLQVFYFDLGATLFPQKSLKKEHWGSSQGYFPAVYSQLGLPFDSLSLWEITKHAPEAVFQHVPDSLLPIYQFFNVPVEVRNVGSASDEWNAIRVIQGKLEIAKRVYAEARAGIGGGRMEKRGTGVSGSPESYVILKLDIDSAAPENGLVKRLMELLPGGNESESGLEVNEFIFEHHTDVLDVVGSVWCPARDCPNLNQSYALFQALRKRGVRAHSWI